MPEELILRVGELTAKEESYKGIVRIDSNNLLKIGVREGEIVEIEGKRKTAAIALRAYPADIGLNIIRMDGITRRNARVSVGENVKVRKAEYKIAKKVILAPAEEKIFTASISYLKQSLLKRPVVKGDLIVPSPIYRRRDEFLSTIFGEDIEDFFFFNPFPQITFYVVNTEPSGIVVIDDETVIEVLKEKPKFIEVEEKGIPKITWEDIGDLEEVKQKLREIVELPLRHPEIFERLGIEPPKGVLLYGPPGTGKTLLAKAVANESGAYFISINGPEIMSKWFGESEKRLRDIFEEAEKNAPSIIFIDEIDAVAPKREEVVGEVEKRIVAQLLALMDGLKSRGKVIVIGATNRPNALDPALRRPGRFDREIEVPPPDAKGRLEILKIHTRNMPLDKDVDLEKIAEITHGYVGADLAALCKEAAMHALRRVLPEIQNYKEGEIPREVLEKLVVKKEDFEYALRVVQPSAMREVFVEVPKVKWEDIGGLEEVKQKLREIVEWPLKYPKYFERLGIEPPKGVLLYGPPGTGKTLLAKAVANESGANFIAIKGPEIFSKWVGESERAIREIFRKAREVSPSIIFIDEIDAIAPMRGLEVGTRVTENVVAQLLTEMSGIKDLKNVVVIAATNRPDILDPALLRPGRFDRLIYVPPPDAKGRLEILKIHTRNMPLDKDVDLEKIAEKTENYSGADLEAICKEAAILALREAIEKKIEPEKMLIKAIHFEKALEIVKPSISKEMIEFYKKFEERLKKRVIETERRKERYIG
ncbi:MAG: CDC48 family AAA ATPase [Candidatus Aenigmatarchaeota archaeon]